MTKLFRRLRARLKYRHFERDLKTELTVHRSMAEDELRASGEAPEAVQRQAARQLGNVTLARESARGVWIAPWLESVWQDVRVSMRTFARRPLVWSVAVLSLALALGANTAAFSLYEQLLRRPLPVASPEAIVNITATGPRPGAKETSRAGGVDAIFSLPLFRDLEQLDAAGLDGIAASGTFYANFAYDGGSDAGEGLLVSGSYFETLGVAPSLGRLITPADDRDESAVAVLTYAFWRNRFAADPGAVGRSLVVNGHALTIVGVSAPAFGGTTVMGAPPDFFVPLALTAAMRGDARDDRQVHWLYLSGRLSAGVSIEQAEARLNTSFASITRDIEEPALRGNMGDEARAALLGRRIQLEDGSRGRSTARSETALALLLLSAVTGCVLFIAAANVATLLLARAADRSAEVALRLAIGAPAGRLVRWLLTEACLIGVLGGVVALVALRVTVQIVLGINDIPEGPVRFDLSASTYVFTLALGSLTGVALGLFPALNGVRVAATVGLQGQGARTSSPRATSRYRAGLATMQMAMATALLALAGLFAASLFRITQVDVGLGRAGLVVFGVSPELSGYAADAADALAGRLEETLEAVPHVRSVATTTLPLLTGSDWGQNVTVEGLEAGERTEVRSNRASVGPGYFRTLDIPVVAGREFTAADAAGAPKVAIVNEAFVGTSRLGTDVVGKRMALGAGGSSLPLDIEIVGLVRDSVYSSVRETPPPQFFLPRHQDDGGATTLYFYVRTDDADVASIVAAVRPAVAQLDSNLPVIGLRTVDDQISRSTAPERLLATITATVAGLATLLAAFGLYAVLTQVVATRWRELAIRMALGATAGDIRRSISGQLGRIVIAGIVIGGLVAFVLGRLGRSLLFGVDGLQPGILLGAVGVALVVAVAAAIVPARRAVRVDPAVALRHD